MTDRSCRPQRRPGAAIAQALQAQRLDPGPPAAPPRAGAVEAAPGVKKLGRIGQVGHRITGDRRSRMRGIGWEYVHVAIDDASRSRAAETNLIGRASVRCRDVRVYYYNSERGHGALHGRPPISCLMGPDNPVAVHN